MSTLSQLPVWPPAELCHADKLGLISCDARDYALAHGIVYRALPAAGNPTPQDTTIHAPMTVVPTPFPRALFEKARKLQPLFNQLYARVAMADDFLVSVFETSVCKVDDFQRRLYDIWLAVCDEGIVQRMHLGLFRNDYLMQMSEQDTLELQQVEFNTIAASFGALCTKLSAMHRHLYRTGAYASMHPALSLENMPTNKALYTLASGIAQAHQHYVTKTRLSFTASPSVLFVVQPDERNSFDQRAIEYALEAEHGISVLRASLEELHTAASIHGSQRVLVVHSPRAASPIEISVVYFRAGYSPSDYPSDGAWLARHIMERSLAIKCPTIALQLAGAKKVQQVLAEPQVLERFVGPDSDALRSTFTQLWPMDRSALGQEAVSLARRSPEKYVLKPQREGGSNNIYKTDIPPALDFMEQRDAERAKRGEDSSVAEREAYILMSLIQTPQHRGALMLRAGQGDTASLVTDTVSELGMYGTVLFGDNEVLSEHSDGFLLRTKGSDSNEGGVAVGYSVIDTPLLV